MFSRNESRLTDPFWRSAVLTGITLAGLVALQAAAPKLYTLPGGRYPATMIELMASRAIAFNPGIRGYYEQIFFSKESRDQDQRHAKWSSIGHVYDPFRVYRPPANVRNLGGWMYTNSFGYVGPQWTLHKPSNTRRIALLGDSVTEGLRIKPYLRFGNLLENRLNASIPNGSSQRFEVLNFSVDGYVLSQILDVAVEDVPRFQPDTYVLALTELSVFRGWDTHLVDLIALNANLKYGILRQIAGQAHASPVDDDYMLHAKLAPFRMTALREILSQLKSAAEQHHAEFVVVLVPTLEDADLSHKRFEGIPELLQSLGITTVNLLDTFDRIPNLMPLRMYRWDVHPNPLGHAMIADNLYVKLRQQPKACVALAGENSAFCKQ
jgi:lysophospholipase L1-like esterase